MQKKPVKLLLVDDHQIMIDGIKSMLNEQDDILVAGSANNGKEAIDYLKTNHVDVILIDVEMPVMNGIEATKIITENFPDIKIIALTTYNEKSIINAMVEAGARGYVLKNVDNSTLQKAILSVIEDKEFFSSDVTISMAKSSLNKGNYKDKTNPEFYKTLSNREMEILKSVVDGYSNKEIAKNLFISPKTVETHRNAVMKKLNAHNTATLVKNAIKYGIIE